MFNMWFQPLKKREDRPELRPQGVRMKGQEWWWALGGSRRVDSREGKLSIPEMPQELMSGEGMGLAGPLAATSEQCPNLSPATF